jgi:hypothetical protein
MEKAFSRWQKEFFENGVAAFEPKRPTNHSTEQERIAYLETEAAPGKRIRGPLQQRSAEQRDGLRHAEGHACWAAAGDPCRA